MHTAGLLVLQPRTVFHGYMHSNLTMGHNKNFTRHDRCFW